LIQEEPNCPRGAAGSLEGIEYQANRRLHLGVRIEIQPPVGPIDQPDRWPNLQLAATSFVELAAAHSCAQDM
jgi:hypothetical protein